MKQLLLITFLFSNTLYAQIIPFNGKLLDHKTKEPIAFAHIQFKNSNIGVSTTEDGKFKLVIEKKLLNSEVFISCLSYKDTLVIANQIYNKDFYLQPKTVQLKEVVIEKYEAKKVTIGTIKGKKKTRHLHRQDTTMIAQFITGNKINSSINYLEKVTLKFTDKIINQSKIRIRIYDRDSISGAPLNDLLSESIIININNTQKKYEVDFADFFVEVPEDGFFVAIEKLIIPMNRCFIAPIEKSTYPRYTSEFNKKKESKDSENSKLLSFEKYRDEVTSYAPVVYLSDKKEKHIDFGNLYSLNSNKWEVYKIGYMLPMEIILSN
ncbi:carboxypeptidase-like regulatory domain-containing protein [Winogradskyella sp. PE311]|uniref:carboxypeptidase-like regulatory domain-containing protein n=1 Tax=Winogradskyella sp. PE311 TaxID=3366943 RepID=UPI0039805738